MSQSDPTTSSDEHAPSLGQTGGLPGANAVPEASRTTDDEAKDTISAGEVAPPEPGAAPPPASAQEWDDE